GTYVVSTAMRTGGFANNPCALMYGPNTEVRGASADASIIQLAANASGNTTLSATTTAVFAPWNVNQDRMTFTDFTVDGNGGNQTDQFHGIFIWRQRTAKIHRVRVKNCRGTNNSGGATETVCLWVNGSSDVTLVDCDVI